MCFSKAKQTIGHMLGMVGPTGMKQKVNALVGYWIRYIIKTHVRGFFDSDLHEISWHFATHEAIRPSGF